MSKQVLIEQISVNELVLILTEQIREQLANVVLPQHENQNEVRELLTREDLSELLAVSLPTIHNWIKEGILIPYKMGNRTYFKRSEVLDYIYSTNNKNVA